MDDAVEIVRDTLSGLAARYESEDEMEISDEGEISQNVEFNKDLDRGEDIEELNDSLTKASISPLTDVIYLRIDRPLAFHKWCAAVARITDPWVLKRSCERKIQTLVKSLAKLSRAGDDELAQFQILAQLHHIQLIQPWVGTFKPDWLHAGLRLANLHHVANQSTTFGSLLDPTTWSQALRHHHVKKIPLTELYSILASSLSSSFHHQQATQDSITLLFNIIQKDLRSTNPQLLKEGLKVLTWLPDVDLVAGYLPQILNITDELAILEVMIRILQIRGPELGIPYSQLVQLILLGLRSSQHYVSGLRLGLLAIKLPEFPVRAIIFSVTGVLARLIAPSDSFIHSGPVRPWVQIKALRLLAAAAQPSLTKIFLPLVIDCLVNASFYPRAGLAVMVEAAHTIGSLDFTLTDTTTNTLEPVINVITSLAQSKLPLQKRAAVCMLQLLLPHIHILLPNVGSNIRTLLMSEISINGSFEAFEVSFKLGLDIEEIAKCLSQVQDIHMVAHSLEWWFEKNHPSILERDIKLMLQVVFQIIPCQSSQSLNQLSYALKVASFDPTYSPLLIILVELSLAVLDSSYIAMLDSEKQQFIEHLINVTLGNTELECLVLKAMFRKPNTYLSNNPQLLNKIGQLKSPLKLVVLNCALSCSNSMQK